MTVPQSPARGQSGSWQRHSRRDGRVDRSVGTLRTKLREWGIAENTIIWYASDNGANDNMLEGTPLRGIQRPFPWCKGNHLGSRYSLTRHHRMAGHDCGGANSHHAQQHHGYVPNHCRDSGPQHSCRTRPLGRYQHLAVSFWKQHTHHAEATAIPFGTS